MKSKLNKSLDVIIPFTLNKSKVRGRFVKLDATVSKMLDRHKYPKIVSLLLAELIVSCCCLGSMLKFDGVFSLQMTSKGPITTMLADLTSNGEVRCYAKFNYQKIINLKNKHPNKLEELLPKGYLAFTSTMENTDKRFQGIVPIQKGPFSETIHAYFENSEQIKTEFKVSTLLENDNLSVSAFLIQETPFEKISEVDIEVSRSNTFNDAKVFLQSVKKSEMFLTKLSIEELLFKLFHSLEVRILKPLEIKDKCHCDEGKVINTLKSLSKEELLNLTYSDGSLDIICEFCKTSNKFTKEDLKILSQ